MPWELIIPIWARWSKSNERRMNISLVQHNFIIEHPESTRMNLLLGLEKVPSLKYPMTHHFGANDPSSYCATRSRLCDSTRFILYVHLIRLLNYSWNTIPDPQGSCCWLKVIWTNPTRFSRLSWMDNPTMCQLYLGRFVTWSIQAELKSFGWLVILTKRGLQNSVSSEQLLYFVSNVVCSFNVDRLVFSSIAVDFKKHSTYTRYLFVPILFEALFSNFRIMLRRYDVVGYFHVHYSHVDHWLLHFRLEQNVGFDSWFSRINSVTWRVIRHRSFLLVMHLSLLLLLLHETLCILLTPVPLRLVISFDR